MDFSQIFSFSSVWVSTSSVDFVAKCSGSGEGTSSNPMQEDGPNPNLPQEDGPNPNLPQEDGPNPNLQRVDWEIALSQPFFYFGSRFP